MIGKISNASGTAGVYCCLWSEFFNQIRVVDKVLKTATILESVLFLFGTRIGYKSPDLSRDFSEANCANLTSPVSSPEVVPRYIDKLFLLEPRQPLEAIRKPAAQV